MTVCYWCCCRWFEGFNWEGLKKGTLTPPIIPTVSFPFRNADAAVWASLNDSALRPPGHISSRHKQLWQLPRGQRRPAPGRQLWLGRGFLKSISATQTLPSLVCLEAVTKTWPAGLKRKKKKKKTPPIKEKSAYRWEVGWQTLRVTVMPLYHCGAGSSIYNGTAVALLRCCLTLGSEGKESAGIHTRHRNTHTHTQQMGITKTRRPTQPEERLIILGDSAISVGTSEGFRLLMCS